MTDIFHIKQTNTDSIEHKYYTVFGSHTGMDDEGNPICKDHTKALAYSKNVNNEQKQYYIKVGLHGKIFNPIGLYSEGKQNKFLSKIGKEEYIFRKVNSKVFDMYLNFLRTKNLAWLNNAERELS